MVLSSFSLEGVRRSRKCFSGSYSSYVWEGKALAYNDAHRVSSLPSDLCAAEGWEVCRLSRSSLPFPAGVSTSLLLVMKSGARFVSGKLGSGVKLHKCHGLRSLACGTQDVCVLVCCVEVVPFFFLQGGAGGHSAETRLVF